jgi:hypothetical protein
MNAVRSGFPSPFVITIGVPKGGDCKTWTALNLASRLGCLGYDVAVIDCNGTHDLLTDWRLIQRGGYWPRFDVVTHTLFDEDGEQAAMMDFSFLERRQVVIFDTCQFLNLKMTKWAWHNCHLLVMPVTPNMQQLPNYTVGIKYVLNWPPPRAPLLLLPCKVNVLRNMISDQMLGEMLARYRTTAADGVIVPGFGPSSQIPNSAMVQAMTSRWVYAQSIFKGKLKVLPVDFMLRVGNSLDWIRGVVERIYGPMPAPVFAPVSLDPHNRELTLEALAKELKDRGKEEQPLALERG